MRILEEALTFDDVLLVPAYSEILPREVELGTRLTKGIKLNLPLVSAAMDTVTEARLAITMAQEGGMGVIHKNMTIDAQAREVARVKKFESGVIRDPISVSPEMTIREVLALTNARGISGVPVVKGTQAVGIVTHRDLRFETKLDAPVSSVMTPQHRLITVRENAPKDAFDISTLREPYRVEGKKTMAYELYEQTAGELPDVIVYPTGGGTGLVGMWKAFEEMEQIGWLSRGQRRPRLVSVQAEGCAPVVKAFREGATATAPWANSKILSVG